MRPAIMPPSGGSQVMVRLGALFVAALMLFSAPPAASAREQIVIGVAQYPSTLHPNIDSMLAKSYVLGLTERPFTAYDRDWELACFLRSEEHTSELQSLMRISYAVFCLKKKK